MRRSNGEGRGASSVGPSIRGTACGDGIQDLGGPCKGQHALPEDRPFTRRAVWPPSLSIRQPSCGMYTLNLTQRSRNQETEQNRKVEASSKVTKTPSNQGPNARARKNPARFAHDFTGKGRPSLRLNRAAAGSVHGDSRPVCNEWRVPASRVGGGPRRGR